MGKNLLFNNKVIFLNVLESAFHVGGTRFSRAQLEQVLSEAVCFPTAQAQVMPSPRPGEVQELEVTLRDFTSTGGEVLQALRWGKSGTEKKSK